MSADARLFDLHHTHHSNQVDRTVRELTSPVYIAVKFALGDGAGLMPMSRLPVSSSVSSVSSPCPYEYEYTPWPRR